MTNGRVHLGLITVRVPLHPGPCLHSPFPIGGCKGGFRTSNRWCGGASNCPVWGAAGVEVAEIAADWKYVDCGGPLSPLSVVRNHSHPDVATSGWPTVTQSYPVT